MLAELRREICKPEVKWLVEEGLSLGTCQTHAVWRTKSDQVNSVDVCPGGVMVLILYIAEIDIAN